MYGAGWQAAVRKADDGAAAAGFPHGCIMWPLLHSHPCRYPTQGWVSIPTVASRSAPLIGTVD